MYDPGLKRFVILVVSLMAFIVSIPSAALSEDRLSRVAGPRADGTGVTPLNWSLTPAGTQVQVGEMPFGAALSPNGQILAVSNNGVGKQSISLVEVSSGKLLEDHVVLPPSALFMGLAFSPDGSTLYASGGGSNEIQTYNFDGLNLKLELKGKISLGTASERIHPAGMALSKDGKFLYVANLLSNSLGIIDTVAQKLITSIPVGLYPYTVVSLKDKVYVSNWGDKTISVISISESDPLTQPKLKLIEVEEHPCAMATTPDQRKLFVANANSDTVTVIDTSSDQAIANILLRPYNGVPLGSMPNALAVSPQGDRLYLASGGNNAIAVIKLPDYERLGYIPVGWFPTAIEISPDGKRLCVVNSRGLGAGPNVKGEYIPTLLKGSVCIIELPEIETHGGAPLLAKYTEQVMENNGFTTGSLTHVEITPSAMPRRLGDPSPIKHVIYIIKENRTYDQVYGDIKKGNGEPKLCLFGREVTPNQHALAEEFVLLDNFYVDGVVSADGHQWSTAAVATDAIQKSWPESYGSRGPGWGGPISYPTAGYIWNSAAKKGLSFRSYGEMTGIMINMGFEANVDANYPRGLGMMKDQERINEWLKEFREFEKNGKLPQFIIMSLPNNHTQATKPGAPSPRAMVADNDLALGRLVEAVSQSLYWKDTAIFVVEDDAQNGPDHVDAHRTAALVISPYTRRHYLDSTFYDTVSMLKTIELILGLPPMSQFDAVATPMFNSFTDQPDFTPYTALKPTYPLDELNSTQTFGALESMEMDLEDFDEAPWPELNRILWHSIKGEQVPMPEIKTSRRHWQKG